MIGENSESITHMWQVGIVVVLFFIINKFINFLSPVYVLILAAMSVVLGLLMAGLPNDDSDPDYGRGWIGGWFLIIGLIILAVEFLIPYQIVFSFVGSVFPESFRLFCGEVANRMMWGLIILIGGSVALFLGWEYINLFVSRATEPPISPVPDEAVTQEHESRKY